MRSSKLEEGRVGRVTRSDRPWRALRALARRNEGGEGERNRVYQIPRVVYSDIRRSRLPAVGGFRKGSIGRSTPPAECQDMPL